MLFDLIVCVIYLVLLGLRLVLFDHVGVVWVGLLFLCCSFVLMVAFCLIVCDYAVVLLVFVCYFSVN